MNFLRRLLEHPATRDLAVDDPETTKRRIDVIRNKPFLNALYSEWYRRILKAVPPTGVTLEIGSGAGFLSQFIPRIITSDVFESPGVQIVADARDLPFADASLDAIVMTDVFHHIPDVMKFLSEASRCLRGGGKVVMIEPWHTPWSRWVYTHLHSEPFEPDGGWSIAGKGPVSGANGALPWIVFERDRAIFEMRFPDLKIAQIEPLMPVSYLLSGGVSMRCLAPSWMYRPIRALEQRLGTRRAAMFAFIELERA